MRRYLSAIAVALVALSGAARVATTASQNTLPVVVGYNLDSTSIVYPIAYGPYTSPSTTVRPQAAESWWTRPQAESGSATDPRIKTSTYSASLASCVASSSALSPLSTGDMIQTTDAFNRPVIASIFDITDTNTATLDRSLDLTQSNCASYRYRKLEVGSAITDGWFSVAGYSHVTVQVVVSQMVGTGGVNVQIECAASNAVLASQVLASSNISAASSFAVSILEPWDMCRVGMFWDTSDSDATPSTDNEKISVFAIRRD